MKPSELTFSKRIIERSIIDKSEYVFNHIIGNIYECEKSRDTDLTEGTFISENDVIKYLNSGKRVSIKKNDMIISKKKEM